MLVKLITLEGQTFDLEFDGEVTVSAIRQKLLDKYNINTFQCYFCISGETLSDGTIPNELFSQDSQYNQIIILPIKLNNQFISSSIYFTFQVK